ncbi:MAG: DUF3106 domain-containing protein [Rhodanobacter sp.]
MTKIHHLLLTTLIAAGMSSGMSLCAWAQDAAPVSSASVPAMSPARPWNSLSATQQDLLAPLQPTWDTLSPRRQGHMLKRAQHWATLPAERRAAIREHIAHWQQMTPEEREQARANRRKFRAMSPQQRQQLHATFEHFQQLPPAQRDKLLQEWRALTPEQRLHWSMPANSGQPSGASSSHAASEQPLPPAEPQQPQR